MDSDGEELQDDEGEEVLASPSDPDFLFDPNNGPSNCACAAFSAHVRNIWMQVTHNEREVDATLKELMPTQEDEELQEERGAGERGERGCQFYR